MNINRIIEQVLHIKVTTGREELDKHPLTVAQLQTALEHAFQLGRIEGDRHSLAGMLDAGD